MPHFTMPCLNPPLPVQAAPALEVAGENRAMLTDLTLNLRQQPYGGPVMLSGIHIVCP